VATLSHDPSWPRAGNWPKPAQNTHYDAVIVGVPTHDTSLSPTNAHTTPDAIRRALPRYSLSFVQHGSEESWSHRDLTSLSVADAGNIDNPDTDPLHAIDALQELAANAGVVIALGGDNSVTSLVGRATLADDIASSGLITLDAHFDLRDGHSNGSPVRELLDSGLPGRQIAQVGIADFANSDTYAKRAKDAGITVIPRDALHGDGLDQAAKKALGVAGAGGGPIHLDIDVDVCDRSVAPATPASIPGGLAAWELRRLVRRFAENPRVVSFDITEIDATKDTDDERTIRLAALLVLEILAGLAVRSN
jgi:formiminoglutamase